MALELLKHNVTLSERLMSRGCPVFPGFADSVSVR
jgi:hypothetical protein